MLDVWDKFIFSPQLSPTQSSFLSFRQDISSRDNDELVRLCIVTRALWEREIRKPRVSKIHNKIIIIKIIKIIKKVKAKTIVSVRGEVETKYIN